MMINVAEWGATSFRGFLVQVQGLCVVSARQSGREKEKRKKKTNSQFVASTSQLENHRLLTFPWSPLEQRGEPLPLWRATLQSHHFQEVERTTAIDSQASGAADVILSLCEGSQWSRCSRSLKD